MLAQEKGKIHNSKSSLYQMCITFHHYKIKEILAQAWWLMLYPSYLGGRNRED
jgi:hypothetical protein